MIETQGGLRAAFFVGKEKVGRNSYYQLIFQFSEAQIPEIKEVFDDEKHIAEQVLKQIQLLEQAAHEKYPALLDFFFAYWERTRQHS